MVWDSMTSTVEEILRSRTQRRSALRKMKTTLRESLAGHRQALRSQGTSRGGAARDLHKALAAGRAALREEEGSALGRMRQGRREAARSLHMRLRDHALARRRRVGGELARLRRQRHAEASRRARQRRDAGKEARRVVQRVRRDAQKTLIGLRAGRREAGFALRGDLRAAVEALRERMREMRFETGHVRETMREDFRGTRVAWARTRVTPARPAEPFAPEAARPSRPEAEEAPGTEEVMPEEAALGERALAHLAAHPDGVRLAELEEAMGANRFQVTRVLRPLMEAGRVRREGGLYFPS